ncbi:MAG: DNA polymerase ligase N-terminal domain-containing protein [Ktedonobacterales bacterium]
MPDSLDFVVQKHQASHLHYDFRLELDGVLKSWAVPKGPSLNPEEKRLAIMVDDHPLEYRTFEGVIAQGEYGAGEVIVWDQGTYRPLEGNTKEAMQDQVRKELELGHLRFVLFGEKLRGEFALIRQKRLGEKAWLLVKARDQFASDADITLQDRSAISGKRLGEVGH